MKCHVLQYSACRIEDLLFVRICSATICVMILGFCFNLDKILILISPSSSAVSSCTKPKHLNILGVSSFNLNLSHNWQFSRVILPIFLVRFKHDHFVLTRELFSPNIFSEKKLSCPTTQVRKILTDYTTILEHQNNEQKLQILEALQIRNMQPTLNRINFQTRANVLKCL